MHKLAVAEVEVEVEATWVAGLAEAIWVDLVAATWAALAEITSPASATIILAADEVALPAYMAAAWTAPITAHTHHRTAATDWNAAGTLPTHGFRQPSELTGRTSESNLPAPSGEHSSPEVPRQTVIL